MEKTRTKYLSILIPEDIIKLIILRRPQNEEDIKPIMEVGPLGHD